MKRISFKKVDIDILHGNIWKNILLFSLPLIATNLLQLLFNMSDLIIVGNFAPTSDPLGSVGATTIIVSLITSFLIGIGNGINSIVSNSIGKKDEAKLKKQIQNSFIFVIVAGIIISILCIGLAEPILVLLKTPDSLLTGAKNYLRIYSIGFLGTAIFNFGNATLSANGETGKPLILLTFSGVLNIGLNCLFTAVCHLYAEGVAIASFISQYCSAILVLMVLFGKKDYLHLSLKDMKLNFEIQKEILRLGLVSGLQNSIFYMANLFIQWRVNLFGDVMVKGNTAALNFDNITYDVMAAIYVATCTFIGQNKGAKLYQRIPKIYLITLFYSGLFGLVLGLIFYFNQQSLLALFDQEKEVIEAGGIRMNVLCLTNWISCFMDNAIAANRGLGKTRIPTLFVILGALIFRIIWIYAVVNQFNNPYVLYSVYFISFIITSIPETIYLIHCYKKLKSECIES